MDDDTGLLFDLPSVARKKVSAAFDGGRITSDGGVALLALADRRIGIVDRIAALIADPRDPALVTHSLASILRARVLAIACGYEDANDLDRLRGDPAFKLACGRLPDSGGDLCSQPTVSRWENAPDLKTIIRLTYAMVDAWCASYAKQPVAVTLDIDDTVDVAHGHQQLSLFHAHYDERCFLPIHIYDTATGRPVAVILRPGKTPSGKEAAGYLRRLYRRIRHHWPTTRLTIRGDGHYGRPELMDFCEKHGLDYLFGVTGTKALAAKVEDVADPSASSAPRPARRPCAASPRPVTPPGPGRNSVASSPVSRPRPWAASASTAASTTRLCSSPRSPPGSSGATPRRRRSTGCLRRRRPAQNSARPIRSKSHNPSAAVLVFRCSESDGLVGPTDGELSDATTGR
jgi:hypothetical protein